MCNSAEFIAAELGSEDCCFKTQSQAQAELSGQALTPSLSHYMGFVAEEVHFTSNLANLRLSAARFLSISAAKAAPETIPTENSL